MSQPNEESARVHDVMEALSELHYLGKIKALVAVAVLDDNEIELHLAMPEGTAYRIIAGTELLKHNILTDVLGKGEKPIDKRDI